MAGDYTNDIPTSIFMIVDYSYSQAKSLQDEGYTIKMGLLGKDSQKQVNRIKPSYYAVQNANSIMKNDWSKNENTEINVILQNGSMKYREAITYLMKHKGDDSNLLMAWFGDEVLGDSAYKVPAKIVAQNIIKETFCYIAS